MKYFLLAGLLLASPAGAHIVPVPAAVCRFDPIDLAIPATGITGAAAVGTSADDMRIVFDPGASQAVFCPVDPMTPSACGPAVDRAFQLGALAGALRFPSSFTSQLISSGDLTATNVPLALTVDGVGVTIPVTLTTGLVTVAGTTFAGTPIGGLGTLTMVAAVAGAALPASLNRGDLLLRYRCQLTPNPDKDQFVAPAVVSSLSGKLAASEARLRAVIALSPFQPLQLKGQVLRLLVRAGDVTIATATLTNGVTGNGRRLAGNSDDGTTAIATRQRGDSKLVLTAVFHRVTLPPQTAAARVIVGLTIDGGNVLTRGERLFVANHSGRKLAPK